jgi:hypothetical protein
MKQASPISLYLNTGTNRVKSAKSYASSTSDRKKNHIQSKITLQKKSESSPQNKEANKKRASSKSIAIPKSVNNMLWFDETSDHMKSDQAITFAHKKAITRNVKNQLNGKLIQTHQQQKAIQLQPQQNTSTHENDVVASNNTDTDSCQNKNVNSSNSNTSKVYIEKWASARRSSSDDSRSRSNSVNASPPQRTPPRVTHRNINTSNQLLMSESPNGTRKRRGSRTSSEMRVDNFKRQHMTEQQGIENHSYGGESITGTSNIDEWGWFVEVPFSPAKSSLSIRNSIPKVEDHVKAVAVSNNEGEESGESENHVLSSPILSLLSKQVEEVHKNNNKKKNNDSNMNNYIPKPTVLTSSNTNTVANVNNSSSTTIGKSNSLLKLWEEVTISKVPSAEQALNTIGSSAIDYLETSNPTLNHVSSFCFEMDL